MDKENIPADFKDVLDFKFVDALLGRRASRLFKECVTLQAQHIYDSFGKFPDTVPSIFVMPYLQAQHLDLEFYDHFYQKGAYLETHSKHMERLHPER